MNPELLQFVKEIAERHGLDEEILSDLINIGTNFINYYGAFNVISDYLVIEALKDAINALPTFNDTVEWYTKLILTFYYFLTINQFLPIKNNECLIEIINSYIQYLENNKINLIRTGYPRYLFIPLPFFSWNGALIYPTRISDSVTEIDINQEKQLKYDWDHEINRRLISTDSYDTASRLETFRPEEIVILEKNREYLYNINLEILKIIIKYLKNPDEINLWDECLKILKKKFTLNQIQKILYLEELYTDIVNVGDTIPTNKLTVGGINQLVSLICHFMIFERLRNVFINKSETRNNFKIGNDLKPFEIINSREELFQKSLELIPKLKEILKHFRNDFISEVKRCLEQEFDIELKIRTKSRMRSEIEPVIKSLQDSINRMEQITENEYPNLIHAITGTPQKLIETDFEMREGENFISVGEEHFPLSKNTYKIVKELYDAYTNKRRPVNQRRLLDRYNINAENFAQVFRKTKAEEFYHKYIDSDNKGNYFLNPHKTR